MKKLLAALLLFALPIILFIKAKRMKNETHISKKPILGILKKKRRI